MKLPCQLFAAVTLAVSLCVAGACDNSPVQPGVTGGAGSNGQGQAGTGSVGSPGSGGNSGTSGSTGSSGSSGSSGSTGAAGSAGTTGAAGSGVGGTAGSSTTGLAGSSGSAGSSGGGGAGSTGAAGSAGSTGAAGAGDPAAPRPIMVVPGTKVFQSNIAGGPVRFDHSKPVMGKLILLLGGICGGTGAGGIESFINGYGFHTYAPPTQTCVNTAPQKYKDIIAKTPMDPDANRQVGDARMELWDGVDRVDWVTVNKGDSILDHTLAAIKGAMTQDPDGDWGYFLNTDGTLRTSDVWVVGYSWGSQTWGMISSYVRFGRVICTSGPQAEGFPNGTWITHPSATPNDRKFTLLGFNQAYPSTDKVDTAPNTVTSMIETTTKAGWVGPPINVKPGDTGPFTGGHQIAMVGSNNHSPGGHTVFCTGDSMNGWAAICKYVFNVAPTLLP